MENSNDRIERLLALILINQMKGASQREKAIQLNLAGFSNVEIANLLETNTSVIAQALYESRKNKSEKRTTTKKPKG
ncbi:MAG: hypothetical protein QY328_04310 [Anaerolineales bacterium]|nr:MAG: hypothetical protein QY328_04310 [Anaerolineales bacterium]